MPLVVAKIKIGEKKQTTNAQRTQQHKHSYYESKQVN
jgi:hypothetical protein